MAPKVQVYICAWGRGGSFRLGTEGVVAAEPALELGCGDGDPLLTLRAAGLDVEGLGSSADMLAKLRQAAEQLHLDVTVHHSTIEDMDLGKTYRSVFLAGPTFNLLIDELQRAKPASAKGRYLRKITVSSTQGPGVRVDVNRLRPEQD